MQGYLFSKNINTVTFTVTFVVYLY